MYYTLAQYPAKNKNEGREARCFCGKCKEKARARWRGKTSLELATKFGKVDAERALHRVLCLTAYLFCIPDAGNSYGRPEIVIGSCYNRGTIVFHSGDGDDRRHAATLSN